MKEIKFRIYNKEKNKMIESFTFWEWYAIGTIYWEEEWTNDKDNLIIMQFTGLLDKNGKEIYEGDITNYGVIEFQTNLNWDSGGSLHSGFYFKTYNNEGELDYHSSMDDCKVIGNIYENGELLK